MLSRYRKISVSLDDLDIYADDGRTAAAVARTRDIISRRITANNIACNNRFYA